MDSPNCLDVNDLNALIIFATADFVSDVGTAHPGGPFFDVEITHVSGPSSILKIMWM